MTTPIAVSQLQRKSHDEPDDVRTPDKTRVEIVELDGFTMGRFTFQPGWRWSQCVKPVVKTEQCMLSHVGYAVAGRMTVRMDDGSETEITAGDSYTIPPGHDGWVNGDEPFVCTEIMSADIYAKTDAVAMRTAR